MKAKVLKSFVDKNSGKLKTSGSFVEYDEKRINDLSAKGFVAKIESEPPAKPESKKPNGEA